MFNWYFVSPPSKQLSFWFGLKLYLFKWLVIQILQQWLGT